MPARLSSCSGPTAANPDDAAVKEAAGRRSQPHYPGAALRLYGGVLRVAAGLRSQRIAAPIRQCLRETRSNGGSTTVSGPGGDDRAGWRTCQRWLMTKWSRVS